MVTWNCLSMSATRLTGSGATVLCVMLVEETGIRRVGMALIGLSRAVADDMMVAFARVVPLRGLDGIETVGASVVMELIRATSFIG